MIYFLFHEGITISGTELIHEKMGINKIHKDPYPTRRFSGSLKCPLNSIVMCPNLCGKQPIIIEEIFNGRRQLENRV